RGAPRRPASWTAVSALDPRLHAVRAIAPDVQPLGCERFGLRAFAGELVAREVGDDEAVERVAARDAQTLADDELRAAAFDRHRLEQPGRAHDDHPRRGAPAVLPAEV